MIVLHGIIIYFYGMELKLSWLNITQTWALYYQNIDNQITFPSCGSQKFESLETIQNIKKIITISEGSSNIEF